MAARRRSVPPRPETIGVVSDRRPPSLPRPSPPFGAVARVGAGAGLTNGVGTPNVPVFSEIGFSIDGGQRAPRDLDSDGIADAVDGCPSEAEDRDAWRDSDGCPENNDDDALADADHACPNEAEDHDGRGDEDGCPDLDDDGDGVPDTADACPIAAEDPDGFADADGCPDADNDGDGVADALDGHRDARGAVQLSGIAGDCANLPEVRNGNLDEDGCPDEAPHVLSTDPIFFGLLDLLHADPTIRHLEIAGHTDAHGDDAANLALSQARVDSVLAWLKENGVPTELVVPVGYGETRPLVPHAATDAEHAKNRRVEFVVLDRHE